MTQHTPDFIRQRSSNLSLRMAALSNASGAASPSPSEARAETQEKPKAVAARDIRPEDYTKPFCDFLQENPTVFHAVDYFKSKALKHGYTEVRHVAGISLRTQ
jgi:aminopeptidase I